MKNTFRVLTLIGALVLLAGVMLSQSAPAKAAFDGRVELRAGAASTTAEISFATNDTSTAASIIAIWVVDPDIQAPATLIATSTISSAGESVDVRATFQDSSPTTTFSVAFRLNKKVTLASGVTTTAFSRATALTSSVPALPAGVTYETTTLIGETLKDVVTTNMAWLKTSHGETVTASYTDTSATTGGTITASDTLEVDGEPPKISSVTPSDGAITDDATPGYSAEVRDEDSGVDESSNATTKKLTKVLFLIGTGANASSSGPAATFGPTTASVSDIEERDAKVGISIDMNLDFVGATGGVVWVGVQAQDIAGNVVTYDVNEEGAQDLHKVTIDVVPPTLDDVFSGVGWDADAGAFTTNGKNKILVIFDDDLTNIDADTVETSDFQITGPSRSVASAEVFDVASVTTTVTGLTAATWGEVRRSVFLTLTEDISPGDTPNVRLIGSGVSDDAGNNLDDANQDARDRISPTITVSDVSPTLVSKDDKVTFTITADEALEDTPSITISKLDDAVTPSTLSKDTPVEKTTDTVWEVTTKAISTDGTYSIYVTGEDAQGNAGTAGLSGNASTSIGADGLVEFEADVALQSPLVEPADEAEATTRDPFFVTISFDDSTGADAEDSEYFGDSFTAITVTKAELDGSDVSADVSTDDDTIFLLAISGITSEVHTLVLNAEDEAGNSLSEDLSLTFTVKDRSAFELKLRPGWNLISLPSDPSDPAIGTVFADLPGVSEVVSYDPTVPGGTLTAVREDDGSFSGTLEAMDAKKGYWVNSAKFKTLSVDLTVLQAGQVAMLPPSIPIVKGWNLIPIVDVTGTLSAGDTVESPDYLASVLGDITRVYTFDTVLNEWDLVDRHDGEGTTLEIGKGYFAYSTDSGVLVP